MTLASNLRAAREKAGLSQEDVAQIFAETRNSVSQWESDKPPAGRKKVIRPDMDKLVVLARLYKTTIDHLFEGVWPELEQPPEKVLEKLAYKGFQLSGWFKPINNIRSTHHKISSGAASNKASNLEVKRVTATKASSKKGALRAHGSEQLPKPQKKRQHRSDELG